MRENRSAFQKIWFRPKILVDVENIDMSTTMFGDKVDIPFYVTATALGKLGNPEGEVCLTKGARKHNVIQMIPTLASCSFDEIVDAAEPGQVQWLQLYVGSPPLPTPIIYPTIYRPN
jgi:L-lactate dehydrogenase (cytochrome)